MLALVNKIKRSNTHLNLDQLKFYVQSYKESFITFHYAAAELPERNISSYKIKQHYQETQKQEGALGFRKGFLLLKKFSKCLTIRFFTSKRRRCGNIK